MEKVKFSQSVVSDSLRPHGLKHARPPCPSPTPGVDSNSCPLSWWCHPTISSSVIPSPPTFNLSQHQGLFFFTSGGQSVAVSALASDLPMNIQDWFPLGWTGWILSNTEVQKHQFFGAQLSLVLLSHPYMTTGKTIDLTRRTLVGKVMSLFWICYLGWS